MNQYYIEHLGSSIEVFNYFSSYFTLAITKSSITESKIEDLARHNLVKLVLAWLSFTWFGLDYQTKLVTVSWRSESLDWMGKDWVDLVGEAVAFVFHRLEFELVWMQQCLSMVEAKFIAAIKYLTTVLFKVR